MTNFAKPTSLKEIVEFCGKQISDSWGNLDQEVATFVTPKSATPGFAFLTQSKQLSLVYESCHLCLLIPHSWQEQLDPERLDKNKAVLFSHNVELTARNIKNRFVFRTPFQSRQGIHPTAVIDPSAKLGRDVSVGPYAVIGKNVEVGDESFIGSHAVVEDNCLIKSRVTLHPHVYIGHSCEIGNLCEIKPFAVIGSEGYGYAHDEKGNHYRIPHTGRVILEDDVHIGAGTAVDRGTIEDTRIGKGTKIDNQCHLAHNTVIGKNGLITGQVVFAGSTKVGDNFICGGKTAITGHIEIADNVNVAGFSGVSNSVTAPGQYGGYPLLPLREHLKVKAASTHVPELKKQMNRVLRKLFPEDFKS